MSWFQTGLSSLTGQIGNFTREVLTEGTEEIEDLPTQLKLTRAKLNETEVICSTQKKELDQLKKFTDELRVQLESKELQIQSLTGDFREILAAKEKELMVLKKKELDLTEASHSIRKDSFNEGSDDTEDVLLLQHKISNLQDKVFSLELELKKREQKDSSLPSDVILHENTEDKIAFLEKKVKALEKELSDSLDRYQHEFASLQDSHRQSMASLKRNHANVMEQMKDKIQFLEQNLKERDDSSIANSTSISDEHHDTNGNIPTFDDTEKQILLEKIDHLEKRNGKLEFDSAQMHAVDRKKTEMIEALQGDLDAHRHDVKALSEKLRKEVLSREDLYKEFQLLLEENQTLMGQLNAMKHSHKSEKDGLGKRLKELEEQLSETTKSAKQTSEDSSDDFESKIIQLKKELMETENARILESQISSEKICDLESRLEGACLEYKKFAEDSNRSLEKMKAKNSDLEAEKMMMKRTITELEEQLKSLAENFAETQRLRENTEAVLAMERRDRECGAIIDRDILKQKNLELERELEKVNSELSCVRESVKAKESALTLAEEELSKHDAEHSSDLDKVRNNYKAEILSLKNEIESLRDCREESSEDAEKRLEKMLHKNDYLKMELEALKVKLGSTDDEKISVEKSKSSGDPTSDTVEILKKEIEDLKQELERSDSVLRLYEAEVERLIPMEKDFEELKRQHEELKKEYNESGRTSAQDKDECRYSTITRSDTTSSLGSEKSVSSYADSKSEISTLRDTVAKQEELIRTLNGKYSSVFKLLEDKSIELFGDEKILIKLNQLQSELESLQKEREHIMSILNDKTREASSLKLEVHRLMDAVSTGKAAIAKLQNERVTEGGGPMSAVSNSGQAPDEEGDMDDMKREAVKKLSQMIKDRDFEIDALNKKNDTLLQVLQTQSSESLNFEIKQLLVERDGLQKQVSSFQVEKDQLVNALNAKHSESLSYFEELMRQRTIVEGLNAELEKLQLSHRSMTRQLDEKQINLIKLLDEHSTVRRKLINLEQKKKEKECKEDEEDGNEYDKEESKCSFIIGKDDDDDDDDDKESDANKDETKSFEGNNEAAENLKSKSAVDRSNKMEKGLKIIASKNGVEDCDAGGEVVSGIVEKMLMEKEVVIREREKTIVELKSKVLFYESEVTRLQSALASSESLIKQKESDVAVTKKQVESLNFKLQDETNRRGDMEKDLESLQTKNDAIKSELAALKKSNTILASSATQKELELNSLRHELESSKTLPSVKDEPSTKPSNRVSSNEIIVHQSSDIPKVSDPEGHPSEHKDVELKVEALEKIIQGLRQREEEFIRGMVLLQKEREQLILLVHYHQNEAVEAKNSVSSLQDKERRLTKECERLRSHLLSIEEGYNKEALEAEEREKDLRNQLAIAQEKISSLTNSVLSNRSDLTKQTENLQLQLHSMAEQRDNALLQLSSAQETISSYSNSLSNLQMVLEQFQSERINQQSLEVEKFQVAFNKKQIECQQLQNQVQALLVQLEDHSEAIKAAQRLSEQMDKKEHLISALKEEVRLRELELNKTGEEIKKLTSSTEVKVDKELMKSLLIGYFHAPSSKRLEAFKVIGHILNFSTEELNKIGMLSSGSSRWMEGIFGKKSVSASPRTTQSSLNQSFSELFVSFLEKESSPKHPSNLRLPTERMIAEQQKKKQHEMNEPRRSPTFNPFSTPLSINLEPQSTAKTILGGHIMAGSAILEQSSHLLSSRIPPSTTLYPSIVPPSSVGSREKALSQRDSFVPIVLAAAASSPNIGGIMYSNNIKNIMGNPSKHK